MANVIFGIDLGTTNSLISVLEAGGTRLLPNALGQVLTPSVVGLADDGSILVGRAARDRLVTHANRTVGSFKRLMGTTQETRLGRKTFRPEELSSFVLRSLKSDAEAALGCNVTDVVITVPAYFNHHQRKATMDAGRLAGLTVRKIVNEPTAAALAYGLGAQDEGKFLVFDLGGGTFDVSILDKYEGVMEVRSTTGDSRLGGDDFTLLIEAMLKERHGLSKDNTPPEGLAIIRRQAEGVKMALTSQHNADYRMLIEGRELTGSISRDIFEEASQPLMRRLRRPVESAIADARLSRDTLDAVVLVGGATRMPVVRSLVARLFGQMPLMLLDPDTTIALGAAVAAGLLDRDEALQDIVSTDVCSHTLGIAAVDNDYGDEQVVVPIIERNSIVPVSRSKTFRTVLARQTTINVQVYQGENLRPAENVLIGNIKMSIPSAPAGQEAVDVRFTYDSNCALQVEVTVLSTKLKQAMIFENNSGLDERELKARFAALASIKLEPRDQAPNRALIARAERLYSEHVGEERLELSRMLGVFLQKINDPTARNGDEVRQQFATYLDQKERFGFDA